MIVLNEKFGPLQRIALITDRDGDKCEWANFYIDHDAWSICCNSDIGNYNHRWHAEKNKTFTEFLGGQFAKGYLLQKFCEKTYFDYNHVMQDMMEWSKECEATQLEKKLQGMEYAATYEEFLFQLIEHRIDPFVYGYEGDYREYGPDAENFVTLLKEYVLPLFQNKQ